jgi:UDP-GlcNAc3NAcA epimerase
VYGDTNSTLAGAITSKQNHILLAHVEAGLRSFNIRMPEEFNRILTDRISDYLFCPTQTAVDNLHDEGFKNEKRRVILSGDVMYDASLYYQPIAEKRSRYHQKDFLLVTFHRSENVDYREELTGIVEALNELSKHHQIILPLHPRTKKKLNEFGLTLKFSVIEPASYLDMIQLLSNCKMVLTDSGGLQKEAYFFKKPCITLRNTTEWVELIENGSNVLAGNNKEDILNAVQKMQAKEIVFDKHLYGDGHAGEFIAHTLLNQ